MSNPESFIDEVNEELKRDRLFALMRKYAWIAVLAVVLIVGGAAWNEWRKATETGSTLISENLPRAHRLPSTMPRMAVILHGIPTSVMAQWHKNEN